MRGSPLGLITLAMQIKIVANIRSYWFYVLFVIFNEICHFSPTLTFKFLEGIFSPRFLAKGRRDPQRVLVLILITIHIL